MQNWFANTSAKHTFGLKTFRQNGQFEFRKIVGKTAFFPRNIERLSLASGRQVIKWDFCRKLHAWLPLRKHAYSNI